MSKKGSIKQENLLKHPDIIILNKQGMTVAQIIQKIGITGYTIRNCLKFNKLKPNKSNIRISRGLKLIDDDHGECKVCKKSLSLDKFTLRKGCSQREPICKKCVNIKKSKAFRKKLSNDIDYYLNFKWKDIKRSSKKTKIPFSISLENFIKQFKRQNSLCFYTNLPMIFQENRSDESYNLDITISADKIVPELGYIEGNVVFCRYLINRVKYNLSIDQIREYMPNWYEKIIRFKNETNGEENVNGDGI